MIPLYRAPDFTFFFAEDRIVGRFHLDGIEPNRTVVILRLDSQQQRGEQIATGTTGLGGWVELSEALRIRAGEGFLAIPEEPS
jgi:hypothetical protein